MKKFMDEVTDDYSALIVTRKKNRNVVVISEESYQNLLENQHVLGNPTNKAWLDESKAQLEQGFAHQHELIDED